MNIFYDDQFVDSDRVIGYIVLHGNILDMLWRKKRSFEVNYSCCFNLVYIVVKSHS